MAFCSNCGARVAEGAAFCDSCGASLAGPVRPGPDAWTPKPQKRRTGLLIGLAGLLVVALVIGVLFLTGVFGGGAKGIEGTWVATRTEDGYPVRLVLVLEKGGEGYAYREEDGEKFFFPLTWDEATIYAGGNPASYTRDGDTMNLLTGGESFVFTRGQDDDSAGSSALQPGRYRLTAIYENGVDYSSDIEDYYGEVILQLSETHTGSMTMDGEYEEIPMWDRHFIRYGRQDRFCRCDGDRFTLYIYGEEWVFTREG